MLIAILEIQLNILESPLLTISNFTIFFANSVSTITWYDPKDSATPFPVLNFILSSLLIPAFKISAVARLIALKEAHYLYKLSLLLLHLEFLILLYYLNTLLFTISPSVWYSKISRSLLQKNVKITIFTNYFLYRLST